MINSQNDWKSSHSLGYESVAEATENEQKFTENFDSTRTRYIASVNSAHVPITNFLGLNDENTWNLLLSEAKKCPKNTRPLTQNVINTCESHDE